MQIIKRGEAHRATVAKFNCDFCGSELRAILGDPRVNMELTFGYSKSGYKIKTKCPVCNMPIATFTEDYGDNVMLTMKDKEEMETWKTDDLKDFTDDDLMNICTKRCEEVYKERHAEEDEYI